MKIFHDWEFIDDGRVIDPISVGMIAEDGRTLYLINDDPGVIEKALSIDWLRNNVCSRLPIKLGDFNVLIAGYDWEWDDDHPDWEGVADLAEIRNTVLKFIRATPEPELWAWYGAYDHVAYAQLFGPMIALPEGFPMWTGDLKQEAHRLGDPKMPKMQPDSTEHHALHDAVADMRRDVWLRDYARDLDQRRIQGILDRERGIWKGDPAKPAPFD